MYYLIDVVNSNVAQEAFHFDDLDQEPDFGSWFTIVEASSKEEALRSEGAFAYKLREDMQMTKQYYSDHNDLTQAQKQQIVDCLLDYPMPDYGYDWTKSQKMSARRSKLRKILQFADINKLNWENLYLEEFHFKDGEVNYNVGQSGSEDIIAWRMQQLVSKTRN